MLSEVITLPTPTPLVDFQKSLIKMLVYERDLTQLALNSSQDPVMTSVVFQAEEGDYQATVQSFSAQAQSLSGLLAANKNSQSNAGWPLSSIINAVNPLYINHAYAQIGGVVTDPIEDLAINLGFSAQAAAQIADFTANLVDDAVLQIGKNILMTLIQKEVLAHIQNSGTRGS